MKSILNFVFSFIFFGLIFFAIHRFLPEQFDMLVNGADWLYNLLEGVVMSVMDKIKGVQTT